MVKEAIQGDSKAIEELLVQLRPLVIAYSKRYGGRQGMDEDAFQEGMLEILEGLEDYDPHRKIPFLAYITTRIRYYYWNRRRREKTCYYLEEKIGSDGTTTFMDNIEDTTCNIEEGCIKQEAYKKLKEAIEELTQCQKEIVIQYYFGHKTLKEIANKRGIHPISVAKTKGLALKKLKEYLKEIY